MKKLLLLFAFVISANVYSQTLLKRTIMVEERKISNLPTIPAYADDDLLVIVDTSTGITSHTTVSDLMAGAMCNVKCTRMTLTSAQILALFTTPFQIVPALGAGLGIEILSAKAGMTFNTIAYTTNFQLILETATSTRHQASEGQILRTTAAGTYYGNFGLQTLGALNTTQMVANQPLMLTISGGNTAVGNSTLTIYVYYRVVAL